MESQHNVAALNVEVAYATSSRQVIIEVCAPEGVTIRQVVVLSGVLTQFPEIDLTRQGVGIFGEAAALDDIVHDRDRVEIYRTLIIDPKEARQRRAQRNLEKTKRK